MSPRSIACGRAVHRVLDVVEADQGGRRPCASAASPSCARLQPSWRAASRSRRACRRRCAAIATSKCMSLGVQMSTMSMSGSSTTARQSEPPGRSRTRGGALGRTRDGRRPPPAPGPPARARRPGGGAVKAMEWTLPIQPAPTRPTLISLTAISPPDSYRRERRAHEPGRIRGPPRTSNDPTRPVHVSAGKPYRISRVPDRGSARGSSRPAPTRRAGRTGARRRAWSWLGRVRPVAAPDQPLRRRRDVGLGERCRVRVGRADLGIPVGARQLHPGAALVEQPEDHAIGRVLLARRLRDAAEVIEHDRRGQPVEEVPDLDDLVALHVDLDVPAERLDPLRQGLEHVAVVAPAWTRLKRMPRTPWSASRFSSSSVTLVSTTATARALAPSWRRASSVQRLSVP